MLWIILPWNILPECHMVSHGLQLFISKLQILFQFAAAEKSLDSFKTDKRTAQQTEPFKLH